MKHRVLAASFAALLIMASGIAGSFYLAGAQVPDRSSDTPKIMLDNDDIVESGSEVSISGTGFEGGSEVSLYIMSAIEVDLAGSNWTLLQQIDTQLGSGSENSSTRNLIDDAFDSLRDLFDMQDDSSDEQNATGRLLVMAGDAVDNEKVSIECDNEEVAKGDTFDHLAVLSLPATAGEYSECNITLRNSDQVIDSADLGNLKIVADPDKEYEESLVGTTQADNSGNFSAQVTVPEIVTERYSILAVSKEGQQAAVSGIFAVREGSSPVKDQIEEPIVDDASNQTGSDIPAADKGVTVAQENETASTTNDTGQARVQIDEEQVEKGGTLGIQGDGFEPNTPVQVFINNVQITNIITNIEGSFNTVVIVPTVVNNGNAEVSVRTEQTNVVRNIDVVQEDNENRGPATIRFDAVLDGDNTRRLEGAPVTVFDTRTGELVESDKAPFMVELDKGKYSVFYSDYREFKFSSAEPGRWIDTPGGGSGLLTVREGRNATVTATYDEVPTPAPQSPAKSSLVLKAQDTDGNALQGMFVSVYDAQSGNKIKQGFTELRIEDLSKGTYPIFFANFGQMTFVSASPGSWVQTPYGGAGLVVIPKDGTSRELVITATYDRTTSVVEDESEIQAPLDIRGHVFTVTSNQTRPEGPFEISGNMALRVQSEEPVSASLTAYLMSVREDSNENVDLESQRSRDHDTFQIVDFKPEVAAPTGPNSYLVVGTADLLLNGDMYSNDEAIQVIIRGGEELTPTNVEIQFQGDHRYSGANRLETLYAVVTDGFQ